MMGHANPVSMIFEPGTSDNTKTALGFVTKLGAVRRGASCV